MDYFLPILVLMIQMGCSGSHSKENQADQSLKEKTLRPIKPGSSYSDTIKIKSAAAVFYSPDSAQLDKLKAITDKMIFESTMHECFYQMRNSRNILKKFYKHIQVTEVTNARYVVFEKRNGEKEYVDLNTQGNPCGLFIFDGSKSYKLVDMTNIETELGFYFRDSSNRQ